MRCASSSCCALLLAMVLLAGCNDAAPSGANRLLGSWRGTLRIDENKASETLSAEQLAQLKGATMEIAFTADGKMKLSGTVTGKPTKSSGSWELVRSEGDKVTIKSAEADGTAMDVQLEFDGTDSFMMPLPGPLADAGAMEFRRIR